MSSDLLFILKRTTRRSASIMSWSSIFESTATINKPTGQAYSHWPNSPTIIRNTRPRQFPPSSPITDFIRACPSFLHPLSQRHLPRIRTSNNSNRPRLYFSANSSKLGNPWRPRPIVVVVLPPHSYLATKCGFSDATSPQLVLPPSGMFVV